MKRKMKKSLAFILSFVLVITCMFTFNAVAFAADEEDTEVVEECTHDAMYEIPQEDATCTLDGTEGGYFQCMDCGEYFWDKDAESPMTQEDVDALVIPATGHDYEIDEEKSIEATCIDDGYTVYVCEVCGAEYAEKVAATGVHTLELNADGYYECTVCGAEFIADENGQPTDTPAIDKGMGVVTEHNYELDEDASYAATCTEDGLNVYVCTDVITDEETGEETICGDTVTDVIPATGHDYQAVDEVAATCIAEGVAAHYECSVCGALATYDEDTDEYTEVSEEDLVIEVADHDFVHVEGTEATCTEDGTVGYYYCNNCGLIFAEAEDADGNVVPADTPSIDTGMIGGEAIAIPATGHDYQAETTVEATCTEPGTITYTCSVCGDTYEETYYADHDLVYVDGTEATCTENGTAGYYECTVCGEKFADEEGSLLVDSTMALDPATGHSYVGTIDGSELTYYCENEYESAEEAADADDAVTVDLGTEPITVDYVTDDASYDEEYEVYTGTLVVSYTYDVVVGTDDNGEDIIESVTVNITLDLSDDNITVEKIDDGQYTIMVGDEELDLEHEHTALDPTIENVVDATCTATGSHEEVYYCTVCGHEISRETVTDDALDHDLYLIDGQEATCTEDGYEAYYVCINCGAIYYTSEVTIDEDGNAIAPETPNVDTNMGVGDDGTPATSRSLVSIPAYNHVDPETGESALEPVEEVPATCTENGVAAHYVCTLCGALFTGEEVTDEEGNTTVEYTEVSEDDLTLYTGGHIVNKVVVENYTDPTCTEDGSYDLVVYCAACGEEISRTTVSTPAAGHIVNKIVKEDGVEPTCTEEGYYYDVVYCAACGEEISREAVAIPATGHSYKLSDESLEPTCTEDGWNLYVCEACGEEVYEILPAMGHIGNKIVIENVTATCTEDGTCDQVVYCQNCGAEISRITVDASATGHDIVYVPQVDPTCTEDGTEAYYTCNNCGAIFEESSITVDEDGNITATGEPKIDTGIMVGGSVAGVVSIPALNHIDPETGESAIVYVEPVAATCTENGSIGYYQCTLCGQKFVDAEGTLLDVAMGVEPALNHIDPETGESAIVYVEPVAATCTENGAIGYYQCTLCGEKFADAEGTTPLIDAAMGLEPALNHIDPETGESAYVITNVTYTAATDTEEGSYTITYTCSLCGDTYTESGIIPAGSTLGDVLDDLGITLPEDLTPEEVPSEEVPSEEEPSGEESNEPSEEEPSTDEQTEEPSAEEPTDEEDVDNGEDEEAEDEEAEDEEAEDEEAEDEEDVEDIEDEEEAEEETEEAADTSSESTTSPATGIAITGAVLFVLIIALAAMLILRRRNKAESED